MIVNKTVGERGVQLVDIVNIVLQVVLFVTDTDIVLHISIG